MGDAILTSDGHDASSSEYESERDSTALGSPPKRFQSRLRGPSSATVSALPLVWGIALWSSGRPKAHAYKSDVLSVDFFPMETYSWRQFLLNIPTSSKRLLLRYEICGYQTPHDWELQIHEWDWTSRSTFNIVKSHFWLDTVDQMTWHEFEKERMAVWYKYTPRAT